MTMMRTLPPTNVCLSREIQQEGDFVARRRYGDLVNAMTYPAGTSWRYSTPAGNEKIGELELIWELLGDPISDDYLPDEISAGELLEQWLRWIWRKKAFHRDLGVPHVPIYWSVLGESAATLEGAPPTDLLDRDTHFGTIYTHPTEEQGGEPLNWLRLPVRDKLWRSGHADKGGFIQEATGFKPSALQPALDLRVLGAAGVDWGDRS